MTTTPGRYPRPSIEIEYDRAVLVGEGCCRFVPIVLRLCGIPSEQHVMLTVTFERVRKPAQDGTILDDYDVHPSIGRTMPRRREFPGYYEYAVELVARAHEEETGTIRIKMESSKYTLLSEAVYVLDSRHDAPVEHMCHKGSFKAVRMVPFVRSEEERDALQGQFPASIGVVPVLAQSSSVHTGSAHPPVLEMSSLFAQE
jgi:hypothetical protein